MSTVKSPTVFAQSIGLLVLASASLRDCTPEEICEGLGVSLEQLLDPLGRLSHDFVVHAWRTMGDAEEDIGFHVARITGSLSRSLVEYAISNAADGRGSLRMFTRYQRLLHESSAHSLEETAEDAIFWMRVDALPGLPSVFYDFLAGTIVIKMRAWLRQPISPRLICLPRRRPSAIANEIFRCPLQLGSEAAIHWPKALLSCPTALPDLSLFALLSRQLDAALHLPSEPTESNPSKEDLVIALKRELKRCLSQGDTSIEDLSKRLNIGPRSLQRHLAERGLSYREIVEEVRRAIAEKLLLAEDASLTEVALASGFSQVPAFIRAFRRWTDMTPAEYAKQKRALQ